MQTPATAKTQDIEALNEALASLQGASVALRSYTASLCTLELLVGDSEGKHNVVIALGASQRVCGPVRWESQNLKIEFEQTNDQLWNFVVSDSSAGFTAVSSMLAWRKNFDLRENRSLVFPA